MSNPRNVVDFDQQADESDVLTFTADGSTIVYDATKSNGAATTMIGKAVSLAAGAGIVQLAADGEAVIGKLEKVEADGKCTVQVGGTAKLPAGTGASLTPGKKFVGALLSSAKGYIREVATGTAGELGLARGFIIDATDTTAVRVRFN